MNAYYLLSFVIVLVLLFAFHENYGRLRTSSNKVKGQVEFSLWLLLASMLVLAVPIALEYADGWRPLKAVVGFAFALAASKWLYRKATILAFGVTPEYIGRASADAAEVDMD